MVNPSVLVSDVRYRRLSARSARKDLWQFLAAWRADLPDDFEGISDSEVDSWRDKSQQAQYRPPAPRRTQQRLP